MTKIDVLDEGFVRLVDHMGGDDSVVQAARVSYGAGTKTPSDDRTLIRYLMRKRHTTPFEQVEFKFHVKVPMDCWRQWIRHRTASVNEYSTRYSEAISDMGMACYWRKQATGNKQGSDDNDKLTEWPAGYSWAGSDIGQYLTHREEELQKCAREVYKERLALGVAREQARKDLPLSTYTEAYWKIDLHNLFHFLGLRLDEHAQWEIRQYAKAVLELIEPHVPVSVEAFRDYRLNAMTLSAAEIAGIKRLTNKESISSWCIGMGEREASEFGDKLKILGIK